MIADYVIHYDVAAFFVTLMILFFFSLHKNIGTRQNKVFNFFIWLVIISDVFDLFTIFFFQWTKVLPLWFTYTINEIYFFSFNAAAAAYFSYVVATTRGEEKFSTSDKIRMFGPILVDAILILSTPWTHWVFWFEDNGGASLDYLHGGGLTVLYFNALLYVGMSLLDSRVYRKNMNGKQVVVMYFNTCACFASVLVQMLLLPKVMIVEFALSLVLLFLFLSVENPESYQNKQLGIYNKYALCKKADSHIGKKKAFSILGIQIEGFQYINEIIGMANGDIILKDIVKFLKETMPSMEIFHLDGVRFAVLSKDSQQNWMETVEKIKRRFEQPFLAESVSICLQVRMCSLQYPEHFASLEDLLDTLDDVLEDKQKRKNYYTVGTDSNELIGKKRERKILLAMREALEKGGFEVYYQPIYSVERKGFNSAEALIRLRNEELGFISPEEFIPLAEKNGMILEIGEFVFRTVCEFIATERIWMRGIDYIEVNLSVVQCMQENLYTTLMAIMDEYHLQYNRINLEITETSTVISSDALIRNMERLLEKGVTFSMDDYGTGYSNTEYIIKYPFQLIKIDKHIVWAAMEDERAYCALKYNVLMIKEMGMHIVAEGVETKEQANVLTHMGCDYFQGYLYSKPVPAGRFLDVVDAMNSECVNIDFLKSIR